MSSVYRKIVLITGANRGIGNALARKLVGTDEYTVILAARSLSAAQDAAAELDKGTERAVGVQLDVEDEASIRACAHKVQEQYGKLDILVNNAGKCQQDAIRPRLDLTGARHLPRL